MFGGGFAGWYGLLECCRFGPLGFVDFLVFVIALSVAVLVGLWSGFCRRVFDLRELPFGGW